jgi:N utilization substance protein B
VSFNNKTIAREYAFKFIYKLFHDDFKSDKDVILSEENSLKEAIIEFEDSYLKEDEEHGDNELNPTIQKNGQELISGYLKNEGQIIDTINLFLEKRTYKTVGMIEKALLGLGVYEMNFLKTPPKVVINEYINISKKFGTKESSAFVNGILDKVSKEL